MAFRCCFRPCRSPLATDGVLYVRTDLLAGGSDRLLVAHLRRRREDSNLPSTIARLSNHTDLASHVTLDRHHWPGVAFQIRTRPVGSRAGFPFHGFADVRLLWSATDTRATRRSERLANRRAKSGILSGTFRRNPGFRRHFVRFSCAGDRDAKVQKAAICWGLFGRGGGI